MVISIYFNYKKPEGNGEYLTGLMQVKGACLASVCRTRRREG